MKLLELFKELTVHPKNAEELKGMVLQLAVEGRLTKEWRANQRNLMQADSVLQQIDSERTRLVEAKVIKRQKPLAPIESKEQPFELPPSWAWARLGAAGLINPRNSLEDEQRVGFVPMKAINHEYGVAPIPENRLWGEVKSSFTHFRTGDVAFAKITPCFENSKACVFGELPNSHGAGTTELHVFRAITADVLPTFVYTIFKSPKFLDLGEAQMTGSAGQKRVPKGFFENYVFGLPSREEQIAIVESVGALQDQIENLVSKTKAIEQIKNEMALSALHRLCNSEEPTEEWSYLNEHFKTFFSDQSNIKKLREAILTLAVQGKLTAKWRASNPNVEPASELLKRIQAEKEQLIAEKKIKKEKALPPIEEEEKPFELPEGWTWCRPSEVCLNIVDCPHSTAKFVDDGRPCIDTTCMDDKGGLKLEKIRQVSDETYHKRNDRLVPLPGDIIYAREGSIGKSIVIPDGMTPCLGQRVMLYRLHSAVNPHLIRYILVSPMFMAQVLGNHKGLGAKHVNMSDLRRMPIPLIPIAEQAVLLEKVNAVMALTDELEKQIDNSQIQVQQLMQSCLKQGIKQ